jgi:acyl-homoserine-lactone acylase
VVVVFAVVAAVVLLLSGSLLKAGDRAEIRRDTFGIPHILADDEEGAAFGFGYAMAEDHAEELGRRYLQARGDAARYFGAEFVASDLAMRRLDNRGAARRALAEETSRHFRRWLQGFASGVNAFAATHRTELPEWMPVVEPSDPLAYSRMFAALGVRAPRRLLDKYPTGESARATSDAADDESGSNAFALAGTKTTSGRPILLGNPHLTWASLYWEAHITVPGEINFYGSTLVGIPVLRAGFNDRLGYVQTNNAPDLDDIYSFPVAPGRSEAFLYEGRERRIERQRVGVEVRQVDGSVKTEEREYEHTAVGPVVYRTADRIFVLRSVNLEWTRQYEGFFELLHARSLREFRGTLARRLSVTSNYTYADVDGNIFYGWQARLPKRPQPGVDYTLDVAGDDGRLFWRGIHRLRDLPSLLNPRGGYVQNANNPPWWPSTHDRLEPEDYPPYVERGELSLRAQVALEGLDAIAKFSPDAVRELKFSTRVPAAERLLPDLLQAGRELAQPSESLNAGLAALSAWDRRVSAASRGAVLFERFLSLYEAQHPDPFAVAWNAQEPTTTPRGLADPAAALIALERAVVEVRQQYGSERVPWGDVNRFRVGDIDLPGDGGPARDGVYRVVGFEPDGDGVRVAGRRGTSTGSREGLAGFGDAWILMVHFTRPVTAWSVLAYGQTTRMDSPHSRDQIRLFANHELRPVWFSEEEIASHLERRYQPVDSLPLARGRP